MLKDSTVFRPCVLMHDDLAHAHFDAADLTLAPEVACQAVACRRPAQMLLSHYDAEALGLCISHQDENPAFRKMLGSCISATKLHSAAAAEANAGPVVSQSEAEALLLKPPWGFQYCFCVFSQ